MSEVMPDTPVLEKAVTKPDRGARRLRLGHDLDAILFDAETLTCDAPSAPGEEVERDHAGSPYRSARTSISASAAACVANWPM